MIALDGHSAGSFHCTALVLFSGFGSFLTDYGLLACFAFIALLVAALLLWALAASGRVDRKYGVLDAFAQIEVANMWYTVENLALEYQPIVCQDEDLRGPSPIEVKYEAVPRGDEILMIYHVYWENEIHPNPIVDFVYRLFRILYYGSTIDTEFVEIWVNKTTGNVSKVFFETELSSNPKVFFPSHVLARVYRDTDATYVMQIRDKKVRIARPITDGRHLTIAVLTWNHEFKLYDCNGLPSYTPKLSMLTNDQYKIQRYVRRSAHTLKREKGS
jgi:hypothetical protein